MPVWFTLAVTKTAARLSRLLGKGGGHALPGLIAERLDPRLAGKLVSGLPHGVIMVTGTNGKTTTTKLIAEALEANGERVLTNSTGSNLKRGITSALISAASLRGRFEATIGLFEVDEASLRLVASDLQPSDIVVLNLFRDQLDRYGELDTTAALIGEGIAATTARLYLNADDPLVASLSRYAARSELVSYFGVEELPPTATTATQTVADSERCPICRSRLDFSRRFYGHIGHYRCPNGDFERPRPRVEIASVTTADAAGSRFVVAVDGVPSEIVFPLAGTYNMYNALAAVSLAHGLGIEQSVVTTTLATTVAAFGRVEVLELDGRTLSLLLVKNPIGLSQVLETFVSRQDRPHLLFAINDLAADGRDVSWLWDVPIEELLPVGSVVLTTGIRGADMSLRLHYAGIESAEIENVASAVDTLVRQTPVGGTAYILPTYTAMLGIRKMLSRRAVMQEVWK
jgi:UDP-N-acetylmuramyl tripeptide synthase